MTTKVAPTASTGSSTHAAKPPMYKVILHNDDDTPMDFVVGVLQQIFHLTSAKAVQVMLSVHTTGKGVAGVYTREIAEVKAAHVATAAQQHEYVLLATTEQE